MTTDATERAMSLIAGGIGGGTLSIWAYITTDSEATLLTPNYFTHATAYLLSVGDIVIAYNPNINRDFLLRVSAINGAGAATFINAGGGDAIGADEYLTFHDFGTPETTNDTTLVAAAFAFSKTGGAIGDRTWRPGCKVHVHAGSYPIGEVGTNIVPIVLTAGQGPHISGEGYRSWIQRATGYGNVGGGQGKPLISVANIETDIIENMTLEGLGFGPDDPDHDASHVGGHSLILNMKGGLLDNLHGRNLNGIFLRGHFNGTTISRISSWNVNSSAGGAIRLDSSRNTIVSDCPHLESADDCVQINVKSSAVNSDLDPSDPDYAVFRNIHFAHINSLPVQGSCYALLNGSKASAIYTSATGQAKSKISTTAPFNRVRIRQKNHGLNLSDTVVFESANPNVATGLVAGDVNGTRTVVYAGTDETGDGDFYEVGITASITPVTGEDLTVGNSLTARYVRIGTVGPAPGPASATVSLYFPNHGLRIGDTTSKAKIIGWNTTGLLQSDVNSLRALTVVDVNNLTFVADVAAGATNAIASTYADVGMSIALGGAAVIRDASFSHMRGESGDSALNGVGGVGIKLSNTECWRQAQVTITDSAITHHDTVDRPHTRILCTLAGIDIVAFRDVKRSPRGPAMITQGDVVVASNGLTSTGRFGFDSRANYSGHECVFEAPSRTDAPAVIWEGGTLKLYGGLVYCGSQEGINAGDSYSLLSYIAGGGDDDGSEPRPIDADTAGEDGGPLVVQEIVCDGVRFIDIPNGKFGIKLGNVKKGLIQNCTFVPASGATTAGAISMRTAVLGIGATNIIIRNNDYTTIAPQLRVSNFRFDKGNLHYDDPLIHAKPAFVSLATAGAQTYSAEHLLTGVIIRDPAGADRTDVLPTAALLVAALPSAMVGDIIRCSIINGADAAETITVNAGSGGTFDANQIAASRIVGQNTSKTIIIRLTGVTASSEAYAVCM